MSLLGDDLLCLGHGPLKHFLEVVGLFLIII